MKSAVRSYWRLAAGWLVIFAVLDLSCVLAYEQLVHRFMSSHALSPGSKYDAAVVFFGAMDRDGRLDLATRQRVDDAAGLFARGQIRELIAVGGARPGSARRGSAIMAEALRARGVSADVIAQDSGSYDSISNWTEAEGIAQRRALDSLVLVSDPPHLMRLRRITEGSHVLRFYWGAERRPAQPAWQRWKRAHRELLALFAFEVLPRQWYVSTVRSLRSQH